MSQMYRYNFALDITTMHQPAEVFVVYAAPKNSFDRKSVPEYSLAKAEQFAWDNGQNTVYIASSGINHWKNYK